jgi:hypothetical protein
MTNFPDEKDLNISATDVQCDRKIISQYEADIKKFEQKRDASSGRRRGAYQGQITKKRMALVAMSGNLAYHLAWLQRYKPEVYNEVISRKCMKK